MKVFTTKAFRARFAECVRLAETEIVYITRPGGHLIKLEHVPHKDAKRILGVMSQEINRDLKSK